MALVDEDGTGKATAESFCTVAYATAYHLARNNTAWAALTTDALKEAALRKATEFMVSSYRDRWQGTRKTEVQALCWPRYDVTVEGYLVDDASVPEIVKRATAELALRASSADLNPDLTQGVVSEQVGAIAVTYDKGSPQRTRYAAIDALLSPYLKAGGGGIMMGLVRS